MEKAFRASLESRTMTFLRITDELNDVELPAGQQLGNLFYT